MRNNPRDHLLNIHRRHVKAWEQKNVGILREIFADRAVIFNTVPPPRFSDFKTFENTALQYFERLSELTFFTSGIQIEVRGDVAWITSQYLMTYQLDDSFYRQNGRWTEVYSKDNGDWKLTHLHSSPDPPNDNGEVL